MTSVGLFNGVKDFGFREEHVVPWVARKAVLRKMVDKKMEFRCLLSEVTVLGEDGHKRQLQTGQGAGAENVTVGRDTLQMVLSVSASVHTLPSLPLGPSQPFV